jgi:hypothetical protein
VGHTRTRTLVGCGSGGGYRYRYVPVEPRPDLDVKHLEHLLRRAPLDEPAMGLQAADHLGASPRRPQVHLLPLDRVVLPRTGVYGEQVLDLGHQDLRRGVEPPSDRVVERVFEPLLLAVDGREEVSLVEMVRLRVWVWVWVWVWIWALAQADQARTISRSK